MNERTVKYYVGRINEENGEQALIQFDRFTGLPRSTNEMTTSNAFDAPITVNRLVNWLNNIDDEVGGKHYYYRLDSDNRTNRAIPEDAPEEVLRWFRDEEEDTGEEDEEETEPTE